MSLSVQFTGDDEVAVVLGALAYVSADKQYEIMGLDAYFWVSLYFVTMCFSFTYGKHLVSKVELKRSVVL